jgi:hypothetical protein
MALCHTCQLLPIRNILKLLQCDKSVYDKFLWFQLPRSVTDETDEEPFVKWHTSVARLQDRVSHCSFCQAVFSYLQSSYHYHTNYNDGDERSLWLQARVGHPILTVYMGDTRPEVRLSANFWYKATPGTTWLYMHELELTYATQIAQWHIASKSTCMSCYKTHCILTCLTKCKHG